MTQNMLNGLLTINKPDGISSHFAVHKVRKTIENSLKIKNFKVGHTGTLDPFADGILVLTLGDATKLTQNLQKHDKEYVAELAFGTKTSTDDSTGEILEEKDFLLDEKFISKIEKILRKYIGCSIQKPPIYSAIKVNGRKLYDYAVKNEKIEIPLRKILIYDLKILSWDSKTIKFFVKCSSGTYIRALFRDICSELGEMAYLKHLTRTKLDNFALSESLNLRDFTQNFSEEYLQKHLFPIDDLFREIPKIKLLPEDLEKFKLGNLSFLADFRRYNFSDDYFALEFKNKILAVIEYKTRYKFVYFFQSRIKKLEVKQNV